MSEIENAWAAVRREAARLKPVHLRTLFAEDSERFALMSARLDDLLIDYSKEKLEDRKSVV